MFKNKNLQFSLKYILVLILFLFIKTNVHAQYDCTTSGYKPLYMVFNRIDTLHNGDTIKADIFLGTVTQQLTNIQSIAFEFSYNDSLSKDSFVNFSLETPSWFNDDTTATLIEDDTLFGKTIIYLNRTSPRSGYGKIGTMIIVIDDHLDGIINYPTNEINLIFSSFTMDDVRDNLNNRIPICYTNDQFYYESFNVGIKDVKETQIKLYPNPVNDYLNISSSEAIKKIELYDLSSKTIFSKQIFGFTNSIDQNMNELSKGIYFMKILDIHNRWTTVKIVKN